MSNSTYQEAEALILDFGSVITLTMFETHHLSEKELGLPQGTLNWMGPFDPERDKLWTSMQRDEITEREYWITRSKEVGNLLGEDWNHMFDFISRARGNNVEEIIRPEIIQMIKLIKSSGKKIAILSNELDLFFGKENRERLNFMKEFDVIWDGTYYDFLKPDPRAYQGCITKLGLIAEKCVFVDDQNRNILGAKKVGLQAIHLDVREPQVAFNKALERLRINVQLKHVKPRIRSNYQGEET